MDKQFVTSYNSLFKNILSTFGFGDNRQLVYLGGSGVSLKAGAFLSFNDFAAAQYCMTCMDQTLQTSLIVPENGPCRFINYRNSYTTDPFANQFRNAALTYSIVEGVNGVFTWPPVKNDNGNLTLNYKTVPMYTTEFVSDVNGFDETAYID